ARILLTLPGLEFLGPIARDFNASHAMNPAWVGHARLHLVWLLGFMLFSGIANIYLLWFRRPFDVGNLRLSAAWQCCNLGGFWLAALLTPVYGGLVRVPDEHIQVLGLNVSWVTTLAGPELGRLPYERQGDDALEYTPTPLLNLSQHRLEPLLLEHLHGATVHYRHEWAALEQEADGVTARVRDLERQR